jgi:hypothetical protein
LQSSLFTSLRLRKFLKNNAIRILFDHCMLSLLFVILKMIITFYSPAFVSKKFSNFEPKTLHELESCVVKDFGGWRRMKTMGNAGKATKRVLMEQTNEGNIL